MKTVLYLLYSFSYCFNDFISSVCRATCTQVAAKPKHINGVMWASRPTRFVMKSEKFMSANHKVGVGDPDNPTDRRSEPF